MMIINHNLSAVNAHRSLSISDASRARGAEKLASGLQINRAADDAAGLAVSEKMRAQIRGLGMAARNAQDGISFIQTTEGWLNETTNVLQRIRELAIQAANGVYTFQDRTAIMVEVSQLVDELDRIASTAEFNTLRMLRGGAAMVAEHTASEAPQDGLIQPDTGGIWIHMGANTDQRRLIGVGNMSATALGLSSGDQASREIKISFSSPDKANQAITFLDTALYRVSRQRADLGAYQNRLESAMVGINIAAENTQSSESVIRDTDMALQSIEFVKDQILTQSSMAMLAQSNATKQLVLRLLS
jgi:flagellin